MRLGGFTLAWLMAAACAGLAQDSGQLERIDDLANRSLFVEAETLARDQLSALQSSGAGGSLEASRYMVKLALVIRRSGRPKETEIPKLLAKALSIQESSPEPVPKDLLETLEALARQVEFQGDLAGARRYAERAVDLAARSFGPESWEYVNSLTFSATSAMAARDFTEAARLLEEALAVRRRFFSDRRTFLAMGLNDLGIAYWYLKQYGKARPLIEEAIRIRVETLGEYHQLTAAGVHNLSLVLRSSGDLPGAIQVQKRALAIREKILPAGHPNLANGYHTLGATLLESRQPREAVPYLRKALELRESALGADHPDVNYVLGNLGLALFVDAPDEARSLALRAAASFVNQQRTSLQGLSESEALRLRDVESGVLGVELTLLGRLPAPTSEQVQSAFDAVLPYRLLIFDELSTRNRRREDPRFTPVVRAQEIYIKQLMAGKGGGSTADLAARLEKARQEVERAERDYAAVDSGYLHARAAGRAGGAELRRALPAGAALVSYVHYQDHLAQSTSPVYAYGAFLLPPGGAPALFVPLGAAAEIDPLIENWRKKLAEEWESGGGAPARSEDLSRAAGLPLKARLWDPLAAKLHGARFVLLVPDGRIHLVNLSALPGNGKLYLAETAPPLHILSAERDLLLPPPSRGTGLLALGNPDFGASDAGGVPPRGRVLRGVSGACLDPSKLKFDPLPASELEVLSIARLWARTGEPVHVRDRLGATEDAVRTLGQGMRILHFATHGFSFKAVCDAKADPAGAFRLSGLALAGANRRAQAASAASDGWLTMQEVSALRLGGVEWVVLSGCDTGVGEIAGSEGVLGLRRAFQLAGSRTVIMSLWPVEDESARQWMEALYARRLSRGQTTVEAVRGASLDLLRRRRAKGLSTHPLYWASFVAAGDWR
ncbi:MAG: CHAT domain-containing protein [Candidatus Solibacter usitatus]|nr:CHAT domain-containing protein [Candidatus Solibacter usitatus]